MLRALKRYWLIPALLMAASQSLLAFSLGGPFNEAYQVQTIGYQLVPPNFGTDLMGPKNIGQGYRYNTRVVYYAADASFLTYFGTNAINEIDKAFAVFNSLSNVDSYSPSLAEIPFNTSRVNFAAAQLGLIDLKSMTMHLIMEQLGAAEPDRYTFALHSRALPAGSQCPNYDYLVVVRNFDPVTYQYSPYVNGVLYSFGILELCNASAATQGNFAPELADAQETAVDPTQEANELSAVAANGILLGGYYTGLTRDDVGELRYEWSTNRVNNESVSPDSQLQVSNTPTILSTSNFNLLLTAELVDTPAQFASNFPGLTITGSNFAWTSNIVTTNVTTIITTVTNTSPFGPPGNGTVTTNTNTVTTLSTNFESVFTYSFGNITFPLTYIDTNGQVVVDTNNYLVTPANTCGFNILSNTGSISTTNTNNGVVTVVPSPQLAVEIPTCIAAPVQLREGMERINFVRVDFDSFIGQTWGPVSNIYTLTAISNSRPTVQVLTRRVTAPDITFSVSDMLGGPAAITQNDLSRTAPNFNAANALPNLAGPGTITPGGSAIILNNVGPVFENTPAPFIGGGVGTAWGSFDGTTNAPVLYPTTTTLQSLLNSMLLQITLTGPLPAGRQGVSYSFPLQATGATPGPYTWALVPGTGGLPPGVGLDSSTGIISGVPQTSGVFDVAISVSDSTGRSSQRYINIEIDP